MATNESSQGVQPLVSVVIPTYNYSQFIGFALDSLRAQSYANWECVIVDDGSTDNTAEVVERYISIDPRFKYVQQENALQAVAKNNGLRYSRGKYVQFLDADDLIEPEKLARQVEYLETHPEVDIVYGDVRYFRTEKPDERLYSWWGGNTRWVPRLSGHGREILPAVVKQNIMAINSPLLRRSVIDAVGPFDDRLPPAEDWDYWVRCAAFDARFEFADLPGTLALVRWHPASASQDRRRMYSAMLLIREKIQSLTDNPELLSLNRERMIEDQQTLALETISHGPLKDYLKQMLRASWSTRRWKERLKLIGLSRDR